LNGHTLAAGIEFQDAAAMLAHIRTFAGAGEATLSRWAKIIQPAASGVTGRIVARPNHPAFGGVVQELDRAGFTHIELDMNGAYVANRNLDPRSMLEGMSQSAVYYAQQLLQHRYFRLDPIAALFWRIYSGSPVQRSDPVGTNELAVDETGAIYPCWNMAGVEDLRIGSVADGTFNEEKVRRFEDVGALTTRECIGCWARNLCGGGNAAVHRVLTGSFRRPHEPWCDAQRSWMAAAVSAFQLLSSAGVHFDRIYKTLGRGEKPSLFSLARAALTLTIGVRPIQEADAEMLTKWENWNDAGYFTFTDSGVLLATKYDREMDALHPRGIEQELLLVRKDGEPFGLLKVRPELSEGIARAWIHMRNEGDYASDSIRKGFRAILKEASGQQAIRRLLVPVSAKERGLAGFLESVGFAHEGTLREAMYLHGVYHDITLYGIATNAL
jgi:radical SAM protein with 4Fe4S-binding SPASM domain